MFAMKRFAWPEKMKKNRVLRWGKEKIDFLFSSPIQKAYVKYRIEGGGGTSL